MRSVSGGEEWAGHHKRVVSALELVRLGTYVIVDRAKGSSYCVFVTHLCAGLGLVFVVKRERGGTRKGNKDRKRHRPSRGEMAEIERERRAGGRVIIPILNNF